MKLMSCLCFLNERHVLKVDSLCLVSLQPLHQPPADQGQTCDCGGLHGKFCGEEPQGQRSPRQRLLHPR